jgi:hypothetical protein
MTWRMMYETAILRALAKLGGHDLYRDRVLTAYNAVLDAMEAPVCHSAFNIWTPMRGQICKR